MKHLNSILFIFIGSVFISLAAENSTEITGLDNSTTEPYTIINTTSSIIAEISNTTVNETINLSNVTIPVSDANTDEGQQIQKTTTGTPIINNQTEFPSTFIKKFSEQIRLILNHFQEEESFGFPGQNVLTDPMALPNTSLNLGLVSGEFYNIEVYRLSNFTVETVNTFLDQLEVNIMIRMKSLYISGNCTIETLLTKSRGPFNITLHNVTAEGTVFLKVAPSGKVYANKSVTDMTYQEVTVGSNNSMFQTLLNTAAVALIASLRPYILSDIDERLTNEVNRQLRLSPEIRKITNMSPVDLAVLEGRKYVQTFYEPYTIDTIINHDSDYLTLKVGPVTVHGLSKFARIGNVTLMMYNRSVHIGLRIITGRLRGSCKWFLDFGKVGITRNSESEFRIQHLQFEARIRQPLDLKQTPILEDLQLETGPILVKMDGIGKLDYIAELLIERLPTLLRHILIDALEEPIKRKVQEEVLNKIDVEKLVDDNLGLIEKLLMS